MPQMAPMMWLVLFFVFLLSLFCFLVMNYFLLPQQKKTTPIIFSTPNQKNWKW